MTKYVRTNWCEKDGKCVAKDCETEEELIRAGLITTVHKFLVRQGYVLNRYTTLYEKHEKEE